MTKKTAKLQELQDIIPNLAWFIGYPHEYRYYDTNKLKALAEKHPWITAQKTPIKLGNIDAFTINIPSSILSEEDIYTILCYKNICVNEYGELIDCDEFFDEIRSREGLDSISYYIKYPDELKYSYEKYKCQLNLGKISCSLNYEFC